MVKRLLLLNGLATIGAVLHHATFWELTAMFWWVDRYLPVTVPNFDQLGSLRYIVLRLLDQLAFPGVFAFLIVSGYFMAVTAGHGENRKVWKLVLRRIQTLVIPYLIWSAAFFAFEIVQGERYTPGQVVSLLLTGGITPPYYYVPLLIQLYVIAPVLVRLSRGHWKALLAAALLLQVPVLFSYYVGVLKTDVGGAGSVLRLFREWHLLGYIPWFLIGTLAGTHLEAFKAFLVRAKKPLLILLVLTFVAGLVEWEWIRQQTGREWLAPQIMLMNKLFAATLLLSFLAFYRLKIPFSSQVSTIGAKSYGIYLIHMLVLEIIAKAAYHFAPWLLAYQAPFLVILIGAGLGVPLLMMVVVDRSPLLRKIYAPLFG
jgi:surface polysaccharide O-acyltransferase-like enzyme